MTENAVGLQWQRPLEGGFIRQYIVEKRKSNKTAWQRVVKDVSDTSYRVSGLVVGTSYMFRVAAVNDSGVGPFTPLHNTVTPTLQYGE